MNLLRSNLLRTFLLIALMIFVWPALAAADTDDTPEESGEENRSLTLGGALRLNAAWKDYDQGSKDRSGNFGFEVFMASVKAEYGDFHAAVQYRWYADFQAVRYAYLGYDINQNWEMQLGVHQVPFGNLPYNAHSFWFDATYYMGFEDDYDTGVKLIYDKGPWDFHAAFYKNSEYLDSSRVDRYSFDLVTDGDQQNEEINQGNLRLARDFKPTKGMTLNIGTSLEYGQMYNTVTTRNGDRHAAAVHGDMKYHDWNVQLEWVEYSFDPENPVGVDTATVQLGAFQFPFMVAAEGSIASLNIAKEFSPGWRLADTITCYNDASIVSPSGSAGSDSIQNVTGCVFAKKGLYTYLDWINGQNMWFAGGPGIGLDAPDSDEWKSRVNLNFGFFF